MERNLLRRIDRSDKRFNIVLYHVINLDCGKLLPNDVGGKFRVFQFCRVIRMFHDLVHYTTAWFSAGDTLTSHDIDGDHVVNGVTN